MCIFLDWSCLYVWDHWNMYLFENCRMCFCLGKCKWFLVYCWWLLFWYLYFGSLKKCGPFLNSSVLCSTEVYEYGTFLGLILRIWFPAIKMFWFFPDCCWLLLCYLCLGSFRKCLPWVFLWTMLWPFVLRVADMVFSDNLKVFSIWKSIWFFLTDVGCCPADYELEAVKNLRIVLFCGPFSVI